MKRIYLLIAGLLLSGVVLGQDQPTTGPATAGKITITGEVRAPGVFPFTPNMTILKLYALVGGDKYGGKKQDIQITRVQKASQPGAPDITETIRVNVKSLLTGKQPDILLKPGDVIFVPGQTPRPDSPSPSDPPIRVVPLDLAVNL
jgi:protein involved in polysaccharide export with SLBB domain